MSGALPNDAPPGGVPASGVPPGGGLAGAERRLLRTADLWRVSARSLLLQALWNRERHQGQGFAFALRPVARRLAGRAGEAAWLAPHMGYFNTHPVFASYALGAVARLEEDRALGTGLPAEAIERAKAAIGPALAAAGDALFWSTLRPLAAVIGILWVMQGSPYGPLVFWCLYNAAHAMVRLRGVFVGRRLGLEAMGEGMRLRLARFRTALRLIGILMAAALVDAIAGGMVTAGRSGAALWVLAGLVVGLAWSERRRFSGAAVGVLVFVVALAWATLAR